MGAMLYLCGGVWQGKTSRFATKARANCTDTMWNCDRRSWVHQATDHGLTSTIVCLQASSNDSTSMFTTWPSWTHRVAVFGCRSGGTRTLIWGSSGSSGCSWSSSHLDTTPAHCTRSVIPPDHVLKLSPVDLIDLGQISSVGVRISASCCARKSEWK